MILFFLKFVISVRGGHCDYLPWVPKNLAMPLTADCFYVPVQLLFQGKFIRTKASHIFHSGYDCLPYQYYSCIPTSLEKDDSEVRELKFIYVIKQIALIIRI